MRRARTFLLGSLMVAGLLIGPGVGAASAGPSSGSTSQTFWLCNPHGSELLGSTDGGPTTTISSALLFSNPSRDAISCFFPSLSEATSAQSGQHSAFGGDCYFNATPTLGVSFRHRIYIVFGNTASLACWDGVMECMDAVKAAFVPCAGTTTGATIRRIRA